MLQQRLGEAPGAAKGVANLRQPDLAAPSSARLRIRRCASASASRWKCRLRVTRTTIPASRRAARSARSSSLSAGGSTPAIRNRSARACADSSTAQGCATPSTLRVGRACASPARREGRHPRPPAARRSQPAIGAFRAACRLAPCRGGARRGPGRRRACREGRCGGARRGRRGARSAGSPGGAARSDRRARPGGRASRGCRDGPGRAHRA